MRIMYQPVGKKMLRFLQEAGGLGGQCKADLVDSWLGTNNDWRNET